MIDLNAIELDILQTLKGKYKFKIENACFSKGWIPNYILLDRTRNIHSYIIICAQIDGTLISRNFLDKEKFENNFLALSQIQYSQLNRPLFIIFKDTFSSSLKAIEVSDIKNLFLNGKFSISNLNKLAVDFDLISQFIKQEL